MSTPLCLFLSLSVSICLSLFLSVSLCPSLLPLPLPAPSRSLSSQIRLRLENERLGAMLFNEQDVETMFTMFDPTRTGLLTRKQVT